MSRIYLDYAATTPVDQRVLSAMMPFFAEKFGNASSIHRFGLEAKAALDQARIIVASTMDAESHEIVFTNGGTEANNLAILGVAALHEKPMHIITSKVEHPSVRKACEHLQQKGWQVTFLGVDSHARVQPDALEAAIQDNTVLISLMYANNEVGSINPMPELAEICARRHLPLHVDAVQAFGKIAIDLRSLPITMMSVASHKIYGPKGAGALFVRKSRKLAPVLIGGSQEHGRRAGTENIPAVAGFARAAELAQQERREEENRILELADMLIRLIGRDIPQAVLNSPPAERVPGILNISFPGMDSLGLVMGLDLHGIAVSNGSACSSGQVTPSRVLQAMTLSPARQQSAVRISIGRFTTEKDIEATVKALQEVTRGKLK